MTAFQLTRENLEARDIASDKAALEGRIEAYRDISPVEHPSLIIDPQGDVPVNATGTVPEIPAGELTADRLKEALANDGALLVRNMFPVEVTETLTAAIDEVLAAADSPREIKSKLANTYFNPPDNLVSIMPEKQMELAALRLFNHTAGAVMCAEAPCIAEALLQLYEEHGLKELITQYLGEPPVLSVKKWMLRRSELPVAEGGWHQDGAFMGRDINTINMWLPLTYCGGDTGAPGMDLVPLRLNDVASAQGAAFDWSVANDHVNKRFEENRPVAPVFNAGDVFFFDHLYLHRTQFRQDFNRLRYAIETWFFGSSSFSKSQIPVAW